MKTPIKIILILAALGAAVSGVLVFISTIISPPKPTVSIDVVGESIDKGLGDVAEGDYNRTLIGFDIHSDYISRLHKEGEIDAGKYKSDRIGAVKAFAPNLAVYGLNFLGGSNWNKEKLADIDRRVKAIAEEYGRYVAQGDISDNAEADTTKTRLAKITSVISDYHAAERLATQTGFGSVSSARSRLAQARAFRNHPYIGRQSSLCDRLALMPSRIETNHYGYLYKRVKELRSLIPSYSSYNTDNTAYMELRRRVLSDIEDYRQNAASLYGEYARDITQLRDIVANMPSEE